MTQKLGAFLLVLVSLLAPYAARAVPGTVGYQGRLLDDRDEPVDGAIKLTLRLFRERVPGDGETPLHSEVFETRAAKGLFSVELGKQGFPAGLFENADLWIEAQLEGSAPLSPRLRLVAAPYAMRAASAAQADAAGLADRANALTTDAKVPAAQIEGSVAAALLADSAKAITAEAVVPASQVSGQVAGAAVADVANTLASSATVAAAQVSGKVAAAAAADTVGGRSYDDLKGEFALKSHEHGAAELTSGVLNVARLADGSITKEKLAPGAVEGSAFPASGSIAATTLGGAVRELDAEKAWLDSLPLAPNYFRDSRQFRRLALDATGAEVQGTYTDLVNARAPWEFRRYANETSNGNIGAAQVRRVSADALRAKPSDYPEIGTANTLLNTIGSAPASANYNDYSIVDFKVDVTGTGTGTYTAAFLRQGCERFNGAYGARVPVTTSAMVKVIQLGSNQAVRLASNGWPSQRYTATTADWVTLNAQRNEGGGCLDLWSIECDGACSGTVRFAVALPYVSSGKRTGIQWAGYAHYLSDDQPRRTTCTAPTATPMVAGGNTYTFKPADCTFGLPTGDCQVSLRKASANGADEDWIALAPGESSGPGVSWWMSGAPGPGLYAMVEYLCY